ncbi:permease [Roseofilum reptotaenium CS-1145]|uniref:Permease n=1 Tax=Roseofilum reptotaenium AO1-A TaxID=1925591 RepID=A0A1L9QQB4_9CYAN|nr:MULTISPECIES: permease [Roseofilum]MBP0030430.1 permease [Roseofilum sp. Guam]MDB9519051.1 permease [Roseofilum reptotaenium CS-1145]OJJ24881.1 permease [Roseofilum reptotaenium AO1-A]
MATNVLTRLNRSVLKLDRVVLAIALILFLLALIERSQVSDTLAFTLNSLSSVAPFLFLSIGIAAYTQASGADNLISRAFQGRISVMVVVASVFGAFSPFCSCGVIPLIAALLTMGVPVAAVMAFWLSSPLMDPSMFVLTVGTLGLQFAIAKTVATIGIGLLGGFGTLALIRSGIAVRSFTQPLREGVGNGGCGGSRVRKPKPIVWKFWQQVERRQKFWHSAGKNAWFLGKWLALAFMIESLMLVYIPNAWIETLVGDASFLSIVGAALVGIPLYLNGFAALPLIGGLIQQGMAPGAGMAFLLAGGATSIPAMIAVFALARRPVFLAYLSFAFIGSVIAGLMYAVIF